MKPFSRRSALAGTLATVAGAAASQALGQEEMQDQADDEMTADQRFVMEAGMDEAEAECWQKIAAAAGAFFALPELHPMDRQEVATAIHVVQNKLLGRPTYRKYLELAKAARGE